MLNTKEQGYFVQLDNAVSDDEQIKHPSDLTVYCAIKYYQGKKYWCWPSLDLIAKRARISKREASYAIERLVKLHWIEKEQRIGTSCKYHANTKMEHDEYNDDMPIVIIDERIPNSREHIIKEAERIKNERRAKTNLEFTHEDPKQRIAWHDYNEDMLEKAEMFTRNKNI